MWLMPVRDVRRRRGLERILLAVCLISYFHGRQCYLKEKPQDALRAVGQSVTFTCNSTYYVPIRWSRRYPDKTGKFHENHIEIDSSDDALSSFGSKSGLIVTGVKGSGDGYWSMLEIANVSTTHRGIYGCVDGTGSYGFAELTVISTAEVVCLTVSPRDQVVVADDSVVLTASSSSTRLRYYYEGLADSLQSQERVELYDGEELNDCNVDERYSVIGVGDMGHADLVIRSVQLKDAGRYIVKDMRKRAFEVAANLVVFDRSSACREFWDTSAGLVELRCQAKYTGRIKPRISFGNDDVTDQCLQTTPLGGVIGCSLTPSRDKIATALSFVLTFQLSRCGEPDGTWTWMYTISLVNGEYTGAEQSCIFSKSSLPVFVVVSVAINFMVCVSVIMGYVLCKRSLPCCRSEDIYDPTVSPSVVYDRLHKAAFQPVLPPPETRYEEMHVEDAGDYDEVPDIAVA